VGQREWLDDAKPVPSITCEWLDDVHQVPSIASENHVLSPGEMGASPSGEAETRGPVQATPRATTFVAFLLVALGLLLTPMWVIGVGWMAWQLF
jgi:hypothetical protein